MVVATYVAPHDERTYLLQRAREAKAALTRFPTLNSFAADLPKLARMSPYAIYNPLFWAAGYRSLLGPGIEESRLLELEAAFRAFKPKNWSRALREEIRSRTCSPKPGACASVMSEMDVALTLKKRSKGPVKLYPMFPRGPDVAATFRQRTIFFEVVCVGTGRTEDKLTGICRGVAKAIYNRLADNLVLHGEIDTTKLSWDEKQHLLVGKSIRKIVESWDKLHLSSLVSVFERFDLRDVSCLRGMDKQSISSHLERVHPGEHGYSSEQFKSFLLRISSDDLEASPVLSFFKVRGRTKAVEIASHMVFPSDASGREQSAFLDRVERAVAGKTKRGQLITGSPNIIALRASNWTIANYELASPADLHFYANPLKARIRQVINSSRCADLSAVMFFENRFRNAWIVGNRFSGARSRLSESEYSDLFGRRRIHGIRRVKIDLRIRKKIDPTKVALCAQDIADEYERTSEIKSICRWRRFDDRDSHRKFVQCAVRVLLPKDHFRNPSVHPNLPGVGHAVAMNEERYLLKTILDNSDMRPRIPFTHDSLAGQINDFRVRVGEPSAILMPLDHYVELHQWRDPQGQKPWFRYVDRQMLLVLEDGLEIPIYWFNGQQLLRRQIVIYRKQTHGEWVFKPGNLRDLLTFELKRNHKDKTKDNLLAKTIASYIVRDPSGAWRIAIGAKNDARVTRVI